MILDIGFGLGALLILLIPLLVSAIRILREYERGVVFQLGRFWGVKRPGLIIACSVLSTGTATMPWPATSPMVCTSAMCRCCARLRN